MPLCRSLIASLARRTSKRALMTDGLFVVKPPVVLPLCVGHWAKSLSADQTLSWDCLLVASFFLALLCS